MINQAVHVPIPQPPEAHGINNNGRFGAGSLSEVPEIASAVAHTIAHVSDVDMTLQQIAIQLLGGEGLAAATVFDGIASHHARFKAIKAVLLTHNRLDDKSLAQKVIKAIEPVRAIRNAFAHGIWGVPPSLPDHLFLTESAHWNTMIGASSQLTTLSKEQDTVNFLVELLVGENGSSLSEKDQATAKQLSQKLSNSPKKQRAFEITFNSNKSSSKIKVWSIDLAWQAVAAAEAASNTAIGLQICMDRTPEEAVALREKLLLGELLDRPPRHFLSVNN